MTTTMRVIIAGVGVLASPVMEDQSEAHSPAASIVRAQGSVTRTHAHQAAHKETADGGQIDIHDCNSKSIFTRCGFAH
jgi:hypothetical protein